MIALVIALMLATPAWTQQTVRVLASSGRVDYRLPATGAALAAAAPWVPVEVGMELPLGASGVLLGKPPLSRTRRTARSSWATFR
ncbi:MAG: hypothetical protein EA403_00995 [Spirochaetaceae bacterium]|nr:MAG: hypothetical protein EA403_00995 [Spirochaetaceae bacterium]